MPSRRNQGAPSSNCFQPCFGITVPSAAILPEGLARDHGEDPDRSPDKNERRYLAMSEQPRRHLPVSEKVAAVKRHLLEGTPVSQLCEELGIKPTVFYSWQKLLFENAHLAFDNGRKSKTDEDAKDKKIEQLEAKLQRKNEVMAELMEEHTKLKKDLGEL